MKIGPQSLLKTKGQKECSSEFIEKKRVIEFSLLLDDIQGVSEDFQRFGASYVTMQDYQNFDGRRMVRASRAWQIVIKYK